MTNRPFEAITDEDLKFETDAHIFYEDRDTWVVAYRSNGSIHVTTKPVFDLMYAQGSKPNILTQGTLKMVEPLAIGYANALTDIILKAKHMGDK